jgi:uncharacterized protein YutD
MCENVLRILNMKNKINKRNEHINLKISNIDDYMYRNCHYIHRWQTIMSIILSLYTTSVT